MTSYTKICTCILVVVVLIVLISVNNVRNISFPPSSSYVNYSSTTQNDQNGTTIVIAYFPLKKSKYNMTQYSLWLENLLGFCQSPMVIFTSIEYQPILHRLRRNGSLLSHFIVDYRSPLQMPPIKEILSTFERQHRVDPERAYHSVELYAVWCAKSYMLDLSAKLNPFGTANFLYVDAGAFRSSGYRFRAWPHEPTVRTILANDRFVLGMIAPLPRRFCPLSYKMNKGPIRMDLIEGTFMGGSARAINWWTSVFYKTINAYRKKNFFVSKDQDVMNAVALVHAHRINMLLSFRASCGDTWFAFGPLLAERSETKQLSYSSSCQEQNLSEIIIPFIAICKDRKNLL